MTTLSINKDIITVIHAYTVPKEKQKALCDNLCVAIDKFGKQMAGHITSNVHMSLDGTRVTSYSQWDRAASKALFDDPAVLGVTLDWFKPYIEDAISQDFMIYDLVFAKSYA
jgi:hypothetical protein